mmetsp:Transcript_52388/g.126792  ORF Transcript_52388/g.126792 Transcript_52388/m.126792 type:complete len:150 (-) Transcript_52388:123-572(-)|eukprot:CAMPEP_0113481766 /NCGR_PEP_ID=MMETSP0014_2-20120614/22575_1 /TAXON_ID=2857 /ORGANISM="Nitzschia sp." /LENGTH=149 /DNA_ID=CAMNT_0000375267 /DNA_START=78 /DNA_END=527 /DNA_ORIENTATION=+ /assembly_acc=CAM_ASM_000159
MKFTALVFLAAVAGTSAFAPTASTSKNSNVVLNAEAEQSRKAFLSAAGMALLGGATATVANAMDQENIDTPTEVWETGKASKTDRADRFSNARTQLNSNFPPIKRLTLERKSPVTRLDLNAPNFEGYQKSYPGLFKSTSTPAAPPATSD